MLDDQSTNASATFLSYDGATWTTVLEDIAVRYEPQGTAYVNQSSGDVVQREERVLGPLGLDQHVEEGDRMTLSYRNDVYEWRITNFRARSIDGFEGYVQLEFEDFGDESTDSSSGAWDDNWTVGSES